MRSVFVAIRVSSPFFFKGLIMKIVILNGSRIEMRIINGAWVNVKVS